jgi:hypothetical protein
VIHFDWLCSNNDQDNDRSMVRAFIVIEKYIHTSPIHLLHIFILSSFKFSIEFVGPNVGPINLMVNLKMKCIYIIYLSH